MTTIFVEGTGKWKPKLTSGGYCSKCGDHCKNLKEHQTYYFDVGYFCDTADMD